MDTLDTVYICVSCQDKPSWPVSSSAPGTLWELDRETFNNIVKDAAAERRETLSHFLKEVWWLWQHPNWHP